MQAFGAFDPTHVHLKPTCALDLLVAICVTSKQKGYGLNLKFLCLKGVLAGMPLDVKFMKLKH